MRHHWNHSTGLRRPPNMVAQERCMEWLISTKEAPNILIPTLRSIGTVNPPPLEIPSLWNAWGQCILRVNLLRKILTRGGTGLLRPQGGMGEQHIMTWEK